LNLLPNIIKTNRWRKTRRLAEKVARMEK